MVSERGTGFLNRRRAKRASVAGLPASVVTISAYQFFEVVDLSATGAKLRGSITCAAAKSALFRLDDFQTLCKVVWATDDHCGVRFDEPMPLRILEQFSESGSTAAIEILSPTEPQE